MPQDYSQGLLWYRKAADQGDAEAQHRLEELEAKAGGIAPSPGNAMVLSTTQARAILRQTIKKKYVGTVKSWGNTGDLSEVADVRARTNGFDLVAPFRWADKANDGKYSVDFKNTGNYIQAYRFKFGQTFYTVGFLPSPKRPALGWFALNNTLPLQFIWSNEMVAQRFADAFNRLLYAAHRNEKAQEFQAFSVAAKAWRENPVKPPLNADVDRNWVLAENAFKERNFDSAIEHYSAVLEIQPMWPVGWFNLAMIYGEQKNFDDAADAMKHYLELVQRLTQRFLSQSSSTHMCEKQRTLSDTHMDIYYPVCFPFVAIPQSVTVTQRDTSRLRQ